ncbi:MULTISPECIES: AMP-binding protein [Methylomonas]|uniref:AMP-dependent synthetase n=1 Tax=Methylomonas denitrificans TaxID=1538553 RepID=A0A140E6S1_9GAMM|nr:MULTISPECIES: AMP-binding protein [Methylomonas]AMK79095.1 AMP-dependent synthetase [Methylomonas denitrificans]OAH99600.1 AMP-dependent synthetase [Methylomonas methanica]
MDSNSATPFAIYNGKIVSRGNLWSDVLALAAQLPDRPYIFNLCENRYLFCICLLAAAARGQICLLPPAGQMAVILEMLRDYPGAYIAREHAPQQAGLDWFEVAAPNANTTASPPHFDWQRIAVIAFTSGSTGKPKPCPHSLNTFKTSAEMAVSSLGLAEQQLLMLSTTPPQHMYGLETSVFWPLFSQLVLHDGRPFFAEDIRQTIKTAPWPTLLASTPTHLRSLIKTDAPRDNLAGIISATDTLSEKLAGETAAILGQSPREIYGSTETLSFASRETLRKNLWRPYSGCRLIQDKSGQTRLESKHLPKAVLLQDSVQIEADGRFAVLGRDQDMVKIGGKRASLTELNRRLKDIDGVEDGFCFIQENGRLAAVVVSQLSSQAIRLGLQPYVDEVFLPRKIHSVAVIPRNETGKLAKTELEKLLAELV